MCAPGGGSTFDLELTSGSLLLTPGEAREIYAIVTPRNGFSGPVTLAVDGAVPGVTTELAVATLDAKSGAVGTVLRLTVSPAAAPTAGKTVIAVRAQSGGGVSSATLGVGIAPAGDPDAARLRTLATVERRSEELLAQNLPVASYLQAIAAFMAAQPEYAAAGVDAETSSAWGRFRDGHLYVVAENRNGAPVPAARSTPGPAPRADPELPGVAKARLLHSFGPDFETQAPVEEMRAMLQSRGWNVFRGAEGDAHVDTLRGVKGDGFFYINTHGGRGDVDDPNEPEKKMYMITSSNVVDDDHEKLFKADLDALRLGYLKARVRDRTVDIYDWTGVRTVNVTATYYGITYRFVDTYMTFAPGSVVFINACFSAKNQPFVNAFHNKGVALFLGWDGYVNAQGAAYTAAPYFVDRMLGANQYKVKESPPQRPFPSDLVLKDMLAKGIERDSVTGAHLVAKPRLDNPPPPIFAPSIQYVTVDEWTRELTLTGYFGSRVGKVTVDGVELSVAQKDWTTGRIVARDLPVTGAGAKGDVVVTVDGVRSNARQLSQWTIPLNYEWTNVGEKKGLRFAGSGEVRFRADVGGYRLEPAEKPRYKLRGGVANPESKLEVVASGVHVEDSGCTLTASGTDVYYSPARTGAGLGPILESFIRIDTEQLRGSLGLAFASIADPGTRFTTGGTYIVSGKPCEKYSTGVPPAFGLLDDVTLFPIDQSDHPEFLPWPSIEFTFGKGFPIGSVVRHGSKEEGNITVSWPAVTPEAAPRDTPDAGK
jgi:hypothetical protein